MTDEDIRRDIGDAAIERKTCRDRVMCLEHRLRSAKLELDVVLDSEKDPLHEDNQALLNLKSDPREDAKGYVAAKHRFFELSYFLERNNAS